MITMTLADLLLAQRAVQSATIAASYKLRDLEDDSIALLCVEKAAEVRATIRAFNELGDKINKAIEDALGTHG
jgi:hypothetical protein